MKMDPFIEAEEVAGHSVEHCCDLFEVSTSAYYERKKDVPSARELTDAELTEKITEIHAESKGTYGAPRVHKELLHRHIACGKRRVTQTHAPSRPRGPLQEALAQDHRGQPRRRGGPRPDPAALRTEHRDRSPLRRRHHLHLDLGGLGLPGDGHRPGQSVASLAGRWPTTCAPSSSKTLSRWRSNTAAPEEGVIFHSDRGCQYTSGDFAELARANGVVLSVGRKGECWDNAVAEASFATIKRELIETRAWPTRTGLRRAVFEYIEGWYNTRRLHPARSTISAPPNTKLSTSTPTVRRHDQHKQPVRRTGSSPVLRQYTSEPLSVDWLFDEPDVWRAHIT